MNSVVKDQIDKPKITVLMPFYNGEKYLRDSISSILDQTYTDFEFLIINDGSTDNSIEIVKTYEDPRIRFVHNDINIGLTKSLNKGLRIARGEYIARMDADDISHPERFDKQIKFLDKNQDIGVCGTFAKTFGSVESIWKHPLEDDHIRAEMIFTNPFIHSSVVLRSRVLKEHKIFYEESRRFSQDYELWVRLSGYTKLANLNNILVFHRLHDESAGGIYNVRQKDSGNIVKLAQIKKLGINPSKEEIILHYGLSNSNLKRQRDFVQATENWLRKLCAANRAMRCYPEPAFSKGIAERWYRTCRRSQELGPWTCKIFWSSPLSSCVDLAFKNKIGFVLKSILHL